MPEPIVWSTGGSPPFAKAEPRDPDEIRAEKFRAMADRLAAAEEVIATYADPGFYHATAFWFDPPCGGFDEDFSEDHGDDFYERPMPGKLARAYLRRYFSTQTEEA